MPEDEKLKLVKRWLCLYFIIVILTVETVTRGKTENITTMQNLSIVSVFAYVSMISTFRDPANSHPMEFIQYADFLFGKLGLRHPG